MRITKYRTELDSARHNILVKETALNYSVDSLDSPLTVADMLNDCFHLNWLAEEHIYLVAMSTNNKPLGVFELTHGTVNASLINPREIFIRLLLSGASCFLLAHNHPSGDCTPSNEDVQATKRVKDAANIMGILFLDHIIVGDGYYSLKEMGLLE